MNLLAQATKFARAMQAPVAGEPRVSGKQATLQLEKHYAILNKFARALCSISDEEQLAWYVAQEVVGRMGFADCVYYLYSPEENCLVQRAAIAEKNPSGHEIINPLHIPMGQGITGAVAKSSQSELIEDVTKDSRYIADITPAGSEICVPIISGQELIGVLDCESTNKAAFSRQHMELLTTVACFAGTKAAERRATNKSAQIARQREDQSQKLKVQTEIAAYACAEHLKAEQAKTTFLTAAAHTFRTPLNALLASQTA